MLISSDNGQVKIPYNDYNKYHYIFVKIDKNCQQTISVTKRWPKNIAKFLNPLTHPYIEYNIKYNTNIFEN